MVPTHIQSLNNDILCELLILCPDLTTLRSLILTHPVIYHAFLSRRRLILRLVYRAQTGAPCLPPGFDQSVAATNTFITQCEIANRIDGVAFREALWPNLEAQLPAKQSILWANKLLAAYHKSGLSDDALFFARKTMSMVVDRFPKQPRSDVCNFARAVVRTYVGVGLVDDALSLQEVVRNLLNARYTEHSIWSKELVAAYRINKDFKAVLRLQLETWQLYTTVVGPGSDMALDWARMVVREYQSNGDEGEALEFHRIVRSGLDPTSPVYVAWSRQLITMYRRLQRNEAALDVIEEVWRHLRPEAKGYRAWTLQLYEQYAALEKRDKAISVCEAAWTAINARLDQRPNDLAWKYHARGAGSLLAKVYRRYGLPDMARAVEIEYNRLST